MREVFFAEPSETVREAGRRMIAKRVGALIVLDADRRPLGVLTDRDVMAHCVAGYLPAETTRVDVIMTRPPVTIPETAALEDALALMAERDVRRLVVVGPNGLLVGILALDDVLRLLAQEFASIGLISGRPTGPPKRSAGDDVPPAARIRSR